MQQAVGEDVAALRVGAQLDLIDGQELHLHRQGHRLDGADEILRPRRDDLLLAGDQRHGARALQLHHPVVDLAGQQPERQADHAGGVPQHALHRQVGLAGVGRPQHRHEPRQGCARGAMAHGRNVGCAPRSDKRRWSRILEITVEVHPLMQDAHDIYADRVGAKEQHVRSRREPSVAWSDVIAGAPAPGVGGHCLHGASDLVRALIGLVRAPLGFAELPDGAKGRRRQPSTGRSRSRPGAHGGDEVVEVEVGGDTAVLALNQGRPEDVRGGRASRSSSSRRPARTTSLADA